MKLKEAQLPNTATLGEAKQFLRDNWDKDGAICPCCTQIVKLYKFKLRSSMAICLILMDKYFRNHPEEEYVHMTNYLNSIDLPGSIRNSGDNAKTRYWGLTEKKEGKREDGSKRVGYWKLTEKGRQFVRGEITVPQYAKLFNNKSYGLTGDEISIREALGTKFNYDELMNS